MPYQGDRDREPRKKFTTDFKYVQKPPGIFILLQFVCCTMGFILSFVTSFIWAGRGEQSFFTFVIFVATLGCFSWLVVHSFKLYSMTQRNINWNHVGLGFNGILGFFVMIASCVMVEVASNARPLRAAGVFGFLGFTSFLMGLAWEVIVWLKNRESDDGFATATVIQGPERPDSDIDDGKTVNLRDEIAYRDDPDTEAAVGFVGMKARPVSSFQEPVQNGDVTTPMLYAPGGNAEGDANIRGQHNRGRISEERSSNSSIEGEWQTPHS